MGSAVLSAFDLACQRGSSLLFANLHLTVEPGQVLWVRGPNGQGKTSLLRQLAGLSQPLHGRIARRLQPIYIGHQQALKDELSAHEALSFLMALHDQRIDAATVTASLDRMGVKPRQNTAVRHLSQGQRRRVALARLALSPPGGLWILDEPFDALDTHGTEVVNALIQAQRQQDGAVILTSHHPIDLPDVTELDLCLYKPSSRVRG